FDHEEWVFEIKYDGYRAITLIDGAVNMVSRNNLSFNDLFAPLVKELSNIKHRVVLDGEVVVENDKGRSDFQLLQQYQQTGKGTLNYYVFDLLSLDGNDTRALPLLHRKELLALLLKNYRLKNIHFSEHIKGTGKDFFEYAVSHQLEGIIAKDGISVYQSGKRSGDWLKIKISQREEAVIAGFTAPKGGRHHFGSLILGAYKNGRFAYVGNCGTGFSDRTLKELYAKLKPDLTDVSPFSEKIKFIGGKPQWVKPKLVCQVKFTEWTSDGHMRHPVFMGLRIDKKAHEVIAETKTGKGKGAKKPASSKNAKETNTVNTDLTVGKTVLHLTNQDKVYFPGEHITKGDIINYYDAVSSYILPYLKDRPQSMNRFPNGINGPSFYQKDVDVAKSPDWIKTEKIYSESNNKHIDYLVCNDKATLLYMANLGCIEINPWNSRIASPEHPDWVVIDLDPEDISFKEVVRTALEVKKVMDELGVPCYCKTSGATGLHIFTPLSGKYDYELVKTFAEMIATMVNKRLPDTTSIVRSPAKRKQKVYIDFLQNRRGQTLAAPYSVRPKPGATVSTPLDWKEVNATLDPKKFTIKNTLARLEKKGDLWKPVIGKGVNLDRVIKKMYKAQE
ncbi:MAG: DNA ligase D, partial [Bacteroidia bacterium]